MAAIDLNCDMGEGFGVYRLGDDAAMLDIVTTASIACGFHAGDPLIMYETVRLAKERGVAVGAHPGFLDLWGFGRRTIKGERPEDVAKLVAYQIGALQAIAEAVGHKVTHVKIHGALHNMAAADVELALTIGRMIAAVDRSLIWLVQAGTAQERAAETLGLPLASEVFADRAYADDGTLVSRNQPGAVIHDPAQAARRVLEMVEDRAVRSLSGRRIPVRIDTVCVHGDTPAAVAMAAEIRRTLESAGVPVRPFANAEQRSVSSAAAAR
jgi:5-oxoprolinase (ATP-hydrolysing) subunit A